MFRHIVFHVVLSLTISFCAYANQNLDEVMARKAKHGQATVYTGETSPSYHWQPETLHYIDTSSGHEVWRLVWYPGGIDIIGKEHGLDSIWSADGSRIGFKNAPVKRNSINPGIQWDASSYDWLVNTDGSGLRKINIGGRANSGSWGGFGWANTENVIYRFQSVSSNGAYYGDQLWKYTVNDDNSVSGTQLLNMNNGRPQELIKNGISGDDSWIASFSGTNYYSCPECPNPIDTAYVTFIKLDGTPAIDHSWGIARNAGPPDDPYGDHDPVSEFTSHAGAFWAIGPTIDSVIVQYSSGGNFWEITKSGSHSDGGPKWADWDGSSFGSSNEIRIVSDGLGTPDNPYGNPYWGHPAFDKWGRYGIAGNYESNDNKGTRIIDRQNNWNMTPNVVANWGQFDSGHHNWAGWTDYVIANQVGGDLIFTNHYLASYQQAIPIVDVERAQIKDNYSAHPRPVQSPDGTKIIFHTVLWHSPYAGTAADDDNVGLSIATAYFPHPPEITNVIQSGSNNIIQFDWRLATTPRGYTSRGWPTENSSPPPPRETKYFRLWGSADLTTWQPLATVDADIFSRYDFATGQWKGNSYWQITHAASEQIQYYAVTSGEHSGLESRTLSNVFSSAGSQVSPYPVNPKGISVFYTTAPAAPQFSVTPLATAGQYSLEWGEPNDPMIRYYNVYFSTDTTLSASSLAVQQNRIASIPRGVNKWVDWLGETSGGGQYLVTSVDSQGNESFDQAPMIKSIIIK